MTDSYFLNKRIKETLIYVISIILMVIRCDWWWWGNKIEPIIGGWITLPMIYQFSIFIFGWLLVIISVNWVFNESEFDE